ncbi:hypothetical protein [Nocardioides sp.]|uniref:hypothetical protein n=1 Tax=Nocardioides sp. TaxID=35761 RepID=UPI002B26B0DC|nr:hypothetical protein [Nocardioides sp.]
MLGNHPFAAPLRGALTRLRDLPVAVQQQARRNAMVAATACTKRRVEREEVADFLEHHNRGTQQAASVESTEPAAAPTARAHG